MFREFWISAVQEDETSAVPRNEILGSNYATSYTWLSKKMDGIWNRYNLKRTGRIYTFAS